MDIEAAVRASAQRRLGHVFDFWPLASTSNRSDRRFEIDLLARPKESLLKDILIAIEVKSWKFVSDNKLAPWIKQCSDYVDSEPHMFPGERIKAPFMWMIDLQEDGREPDKTIMRGMHQLAQYFRVGRIVIDNRRRISIIFGHSAEIYRDGWRERARELLLARRQSGGVKRSPK